MGQRLEDDVLVIEENDIAVSEAFDDQPSWTMFRLEAQGEDSIESVLIDGDEPRIEEVLPQNHGEGWGLRRHGAVPCRGVDAAPTNDHEIQLGSIPRLILRTICS